MGTDDRLEQLFEEAYDEAFLYYQMRKCNEADFTRENLRGLLESLYVRQGNNWEGRGQPRDVALSAMVAAAEAVLSQWDDRPPQS